MGTSKRDAILRGAMPSDPSRSAPRAASTVTTTEEGRAFFQRRLSIFGLCLFVLAGASWAMLAIVYLIGVAQNQPDEHRPFSVGGSLHFTNALVAGALWLATRSGRRSPSLLHGLDIAAMLALVVIWVLAGATMPDPDVGSHIALLSFIVGILARAIVVPSTATRTLATSALGGVLVVVFAVWRNAGGETVVGSAVATTCWVVSAVTLATVASHTIFGLRREVQKARVLGQYTLESKIGEGGMGAVWRAQHALLRRPTAVKLLPPERAGEEAIRRFEREVQQTARLRHPNSVAVYDYGRTRDGVFYYAMELLEGIDLERLVREHGPQPPGRVIHVLTQICGALAEAHDLGLVHRDVKPANVLLSPRREEHEFAKVVDFGLVKSVEAEGHGAVTATNTITGTPLYMSPEAITSPDSVGAASDLYAVGAVGWFLLVGKPPFEADTIVEICSKHLYTPAERPSAVLGTPIPSDLEDVILGCLEKQQSARPANARALRTALEACRSAGEWSTRDAIAWWRTHAPDLPAVSVPPSSPHTIELAVDERLTSTIESRRVSRRVRSRGTA
jgi:serine/threonine protein kinase